MLHVANKTIKDLTKDITDIRRRIELQGEIAESTAAEKEHEKLQATRQSLVAEFEALREKHEAKLRAVDADINSVKRRLTNTAQARSHYRQTAPDWLKKRRKKLEDRLLNIHKYEEHQQPPLKPLDPVNSLAPVWPPLGRPGGSEAHNESAKQHEEDAKNYDALLQRYNSQQEKLSAEREALKRELDALLQASLLLRPTPEAVTHE